MTSKPVPVLRTIGSGPAMIAGTVIAVVEGISSITTRQRVEIKADQHDDAILRGEACQRDEANVTANFAVACSSGMYSNRWLQTTQVSGGVSPVATRRWVALAQTPNSCIGSVKKDQSAPVQTGA
jgi:hypothetical protein